MSPTYSTSTDATQIDADEPEPDGIKPTAIPAIPCVNLIENAL